MHYRARQGGLWPSPDWKLLPWLDRRPCVNDSPALQPRDVRDFPRRISRTMRRQDPGGPCIDSPPQLPEKRASRSRVEPVQRLVEQQHIGPPDQRPRQQHAAPLAIGKAQESTRSESREPGVRQRRIDRTATAGIDAIEWNVGIEESGADDVPDREIPFVALVLVLALRPRYAMRGRASRGWS